MNLEPDLIRAVFFDAGATLLHPDPPVEEIYAREFASDGARFSSEEFSRALTRAWEEVHARPAGDRYGGVRGERNFWHRFLNRVRATLDGGTVSGEVFARLAAHFRDAASWAIYEDVWPTLNALDERRLPLAVVSNWDSNLPALLADLGLRRRFREISVSAIEQTGKPQPEIFHRTCERLGVAPSQALHVGDSLSEDYEGAREAGLAALLLDRQESQAAIPDRICTLEQIVPWIDGHSGASGRSSPSPSASA